MHALVKGQILGGGERHSRGGDTLYSRVVGQVREHDSTVQGAGFAERLNEEVGLLEGDTHGGEDNGELLVLAAYLCLTGNLCCEFRMGKSRCGEDGQLLSTDQGVQAVDGRYTGLNELRRIGTGGRVDGCTVDVETFFRNDVRAAVDGLSKSVKYTAEHVLGDSEFHLASCEADPGIGEVDTGGALEQLDNGVVAVYLEDFAAAYLAVFKFDFTELVVGDILYIAHDHKRTGNLLNGTVFFWH